MAGYDWIGRPVNSVFVCSQNSEDLPLFADPRLVTFLRHRYLTVLRENLPDGAGARRRAVVRTCWLGYDRTLYGYQIDSARSESALNPEI